MRMALLRLGLGLAVFALLLVAWEIGCRVSGVSPVLLPSPSRIWAALLKGIESGVLVAQTQATVGRMLGGWLLASLAGIVVGLIIGTAPRVRPFIQPTLEFIRPMPSSAIVPVAIAILGLSQRMVIFVICFGAIWPVMLNTVQGVSRIEPRLREVSRVMGMSRIAFIWKIGLPHALPYILAGMRLSIATSLILTIVGEMVASQPGVGQGMVMAARSFRSADLYAGLLVLGLLGLASAITLAAVERRLLAYRNVAR
jgi:sulfonate transport system permease protein